VSSAEVKNEWSYTSTSLTFVAWTGTLPFIFSPNINTIIIVPTPRTLTKLNCNNLPYASILFYLTTVATYSPSTHLTCTAINVLARCDDACWRAEKNISSKCFKYGSVKLTDWNRVQ
jgi:hypothetical protein